jgi:glutathione S-transferase
MLELYIGNKNYSSWSLRGWFPLAHFGIPFKEIRLSLFTPAFYEAIGRVSPVGKVPVLVDDGFAIWDSLAIVEYLAERFPQYALWPRDLKARARARSICAEMHSGFTELRNNMGMNIEADLAGHGWNLAVQRDIDRITAIWGECLGAHQQPFLFGEPTLADAFFAPVCTRFRTYQPKLPARALQYVDDVLALPAMQRWIADGLQEKEFVAEDEPFRRSRD